MIKFNKKFKLKNMKMKMLRKNSKMNKINSLLMKFCNIKLIKEQKKRNRKNNRI